MKTTTYNRAFLDEYPLWDAAAIRLCPSARFVGGTSRYLCECPKPLECRGVEYMEVAHGAPKEG